MHVVAFFVEYHLPIYFVPCADFYGSRKSFRSEPCPSSDIQSTAEHEACGSDAAMLCARGGRGIDLVG